MGKKRINASGDGMVVTLLILSSSVDDVRSSDIGRVNFLAFMVLWFPEKLRGKKKPPDFCLWRFFGIGLSACLADFLRQWLGKAKKPIRSGWTMHFHFLCAN